jgi:ketosteroid isomerase-like protein
MDEKQPNEAGSTVGEHSERRQFLKTVVTAAAGLTIAAAGTGAEAAGKDAATSIGGDVQDALVGRLKAFAAAAKGTDAASLRGYFDKSADFRGAGGIARGWDEIAAADQRSAPDASLRQRGAAEVISIKWLAPKVALVDAVFETERGRGWFTEIWDGNGGTFVIRSSRMRAGRTDASFKELSTLTSRTIDGDIPSAVQGTEEAALRARFKEFRAAFNAGDVKGVMALTTPTTDALPVFGFLGGRSQSMPNAGAVETKSEQMLGVVPVTDSMTAGAHSSVDLAERKRAIFLAGEPKVVRFLSPTLAIVDGTAQIGNIPMAHGFAPREMQGVYSVIWTKHNGEWKGEAARPWF